MLRSRPERHFPKYSKLSMPDNHGRISDEWLEMKVARGQVPPANRFLLLMLLGALVFDIFHR
jgi:hypothetical protein